MCQQSRRQTRVVSSSASHAATGPAFASGVSGDDALSRFSTTVENSVEISGLSRLAAMKSLVLSESAYGEGNLMAVLSMLFGL
jgi:hypothetical protein